MTTMDFSTTLNALRKLCVETGSLACLGCGHEHNCSAHGCAILRNAIEHIEAALSNYDSLSALSPPNEPLTQADLDSMDYDKVWIDYGDDGEWALVVSGRIYALAVLEGTGFEDILRDEVGGETMDRPSGDYTVYRRPPEERKNMKKDEKNRMTYFEAFRTLPSDQLARLLLCPNQTVRRINRIPCTRRTPGHISCDQCIAAFLMMEVDPRDNAAQ
ncbi:hypothetical protein [Dysosmobacter welbionis]|uniref:hypothetical protein n=1 Tax=Dysosmobacter welbionis TaxID=2093857 RepID=UPI003AF67479